MRGCHLMLLSDARKGEATGSRHGETSAAEGAATSNDSAANELTNSALKYPSITFLRLSLCLP